MLGDGDDPAEYQEGFLTERQVVFHRRRQLFPTTDSGRKCYFEHASSLGQWKANTPAIGPTRVKYPGVPKPPLNTESVAWVASHLVDLKGK